MAKLLRIWVQAQNPMLRISTQFPYAPACKTHTQCARRFTGRLTTPLNIHSSNALLFLATVNANMALVAIYQTQRISKTVAGYSIMPPQPVRLSSPVGHLFLLLAAPLLPLNSLVSVCRTRLEANPGGPQGGAQTGRSPGGGAGGKLHQPGFETKCCAPAMRCGTPRIERHRRQRIPKIKNYKSHQTTTIYMPATLREVGPLNNNERGPHLPP